MTVTSSLADAEMAQHASRLDAEVQNSKFLVARDSSSHVSVCPWQKNVGKDRKGNTF